MRPFLAFLAALIALLPPALSAGAGHDMDVRATPVPFDTSDPKRRASGRLRWLGGWALTSGDRRFGGWSALGVAGPGRLVAVSDSGLVAWLETGRGVTGTIATLPSDAGALKQGKDAESLTPAADGSWLVGFEGRNAIVRYDSRFRRRLAEVLPPAMSAWPVNGGPEAMVRLADGRLLAIAEEQPGAEGGREALLFPRDPTTGTTAPVRFTYRPPPRLSPSDAALLPDGRVLVLNRGVTIAVPPFTATLTIIDPRRVTPGAVVTGEVVGTLAAPTAVDNLEGVAVERIGGRTIIWLISDDNFLPFQRTLLLKFELSSG